MNRSLHLHAFCSMKGGVGKSTLAVASATRLAQQGRRVILIDADMTGSSLSDGLLLRAPVVAVNSNGFMDLTAPATGEFLSLEETVRRRDERQRAQKDRVQVPPPYFNDALICPRIDGRECNLDALLWRHDEIPSLRVLPASPLRADVAVAVGWLYREEHFVWATRLCQLLFSLVEQQTDLSDVVFDLPPGLFGFAQAALTMMALLGGEGPLPETLPRFVEAGVQIRLNPFLVTTPDRNALVVSVEEYLRLAPHLPALELLVNRSYEGLYGVLRDLEQRFGLALKALDLAKSIRVVGEDVDLGRIFRSGGVGMVTPMTLLDHVLRLN